MKLHRYVDHQRLHIVTKDVISLSISVLLLFRHYISHKITFGAPSSGGVLRSACGAFIFCGLNNFQIVLHSTKAFTGLELLALFCMLMDFCVFVFFTDAVMKRQYSLPCVLFSEYLGLSIMCSQ